MVSDGRAATALDEILRKGPLADDSHQIALSRRVFWTLAELCDEYGLPFDLMIGVNRGVYANGVFQGQDLYDSRVSLIQYRELFNAFPTVKFPISVLASVTNQELVSYAWIFPNVITNGHWWYSNTPSFIARDAAARLEAVPRTKQIGYYSDAYKLEFVWPKFDMYRQILAGILADHFVGNCGWNEERAIELGRQVLRDNVDELFPRPARSAGQESPEPQTEVWSAEFAGVESLDPIPNADEIQAMEIDDVELVDLDAADVVLDAEAIDEKSEPASLDVGNLLSDESEPAPEVRMLRGSTSFSPDEDSLQLHADPLTGELRFPVPDHNDSPSEDSDVKPEGDSVADELQLEAIDEAAIDEAAIDEAAIDEAIDEDESEDGNQAR